MIEPILITKEECAKRLLSLDNVAVVTHARPDADTVGSSSALVLALCDLGKKAYLFSPDPIPERLEFLTEGVPAVDSPDGLTLVSVDVASRSQLGRLSELDYVLSIDHHAASTPFADHYTVPHTSSAAEVLSTVLKEVSGFRMTKDIAYRLYAAMSSDTGGFIYSNAGASAHILAAELIDTGIDFADINHRLFNSKSEGQIKAEGYVGSALKTALDGKVAYATLPKSERVALGLELSDFECAIDVIRAVRGAKIAFFVRENDDGSMRASLRSTGFNVSDVAASLGGGGHLRAAGCSPVASTANEAAEIIIKQILATGEQI